MNTYWPVVLLAVCAQMRSLWNGQTITTIDKAIANAFCAIIARGMVETLALVANKPHELMQWFVVKACNNCF